MQLHEIRMHRQKKKLHCAGERLVDDAQVPGEKEEDFHVLGEKFTKNTQALYKIHESWSFFRFLC